jgi:predicted metal-dependent hydrolase
MQTTSNKPVKESDSEQYEYISDDVPIIKISRGRTVNLGNYESDRIDISVEVPAKSMNNADVERTYQKTMAWIEERLQQHLNQADNEGSD